MNIRPLNDEARRVLREHENKAAKEYMNKSPEQRARLKRLYDFMIQKQSLRRENINLHYRLIGIIGTSFPHGYGHAADYLHVVRWLSWPTKALRA